MNRTFKLLTFLMLALLPALQAAEAPKPRAKPIPAAKADPFFTPQKDKAGMTKTAPEDPALPNVLILGDSISIGYTLNAVAARVMQKYGVLTDDLYTTTKSFEPNRFVGPGNVHYTAAGDKILASKIGAKVADALKNQGQTEPTKRNGSAYPPKIPDARVETYKTVGDTKLNLYIFAPAAATNAPAIVFFFGGGWVGGSPVQFEEQCRHFAARGMVAITADYRVKSRNNVKPPQCIADARSAMRWVRDHAAQLGIDPNRIAAAGGSAGGHLAACTAFIGESDEPSEDKNMSAVPNALVLFNPVLVLAPFEGVKLNSFGMDQSEQSLGAKAEDISPAHHIKPNAPPTIIFHGRADTTVPFASSETFAAKMKAEGNRCELFGYDKQSHGFFNHEPFKTQTVMEADKFLTSLGWLQKKP
jgi:acetyl esterase